MSFVPHSPALYGVAPGVDFPRALVAGLLERFSGQPPEALARVTVYLSTRRMERRIRALFDDGPARLLPRLRLISDLGCDTASSLPPSVPSLRRRLELSQLVSRLIEADPSLAPKTAAFDLATSLAALMDEMQGEGVPLADLAALDVTDQSGHWERSLRFLTLVGHFLSSDPTVPMDPEARQRRVIEDLIQRWKTAPPRDPILVAGSTGSRGTTRMLMEAVARLPNGAVVLPGVDPGMTPEIWRGLLAPHPQQDHPQYRFALIADSLGLDPAQLPTWADTPAPSPSRNALVSLALRPAPVTDGWRRDGPALGDLISATAGLSLIEAPDPRGESLAIALRLRQAIEDGQTAALISPDRMLTRRVTAALDRWGIEPDDSAGEPLRQAPAGRMIRQIAALFGQHLTAEALLVLLKHPLVHRAQDRNTHLLWTRELELHLRRHGPAFPTHESLTKWGEAYYEKRQAPRETETPTPDRPLKPRTTDDPRPWIEWISRCMIGHADIGSGPIGPFVARLWQGIEALALGHTAPPEKLTFWTDRDGNEARKALSQLAEEAHHGGDVDPAGFMALLNAVLSGEVRDPRSPRADVMIWGTLEARVQGADLVILGGLNDGTWPELPSPDPWLNRSMRTRTGLLLPERRVGLSAHDFQQAIGAPTVVLSRAARNGEAPAVPSRWLNRLTNLLSGLDDQNGGAALAQMRQRGQRWVDMAAAMDRPAQPMAPASRPSPLPPVAARPRRLSVTDVQTLIRDPFEIYARRILRLSALDPLRKRPEPRDRGTVLHGVLEAFVPRMAELPELDRRQALLDIADRILTDEVPWPTARRLWLARLARIADPFLIEEAARQTQAQPKWYEVKGYMDLPTVDTRLTAKADRIDQADHGGLAIYDYKTGTPPSEKQQNTFAKQLLLEAAIAENGGFDGIPAAPVYRATYLGLGGQLKSVDAPLAKSPVTETLAELTELIAAYLDPDKGYTAQLAPETERFESDYAQLSRAGEWDLGDAPVPVRVGQ
ncbi:double-strand break repair protein AddB [Pseudoruegeria sp. SK021]|uniref:double-strand break repair protein AddB n=1 Tax=Pseudoruegeria sp. SK021 TaxID=1933035 RepID=UPI000A241F43|nr:double-strand break repair protein AddB [Pseudoruegeria sp. SK021]OSP55355.1 double-strand break repair protein AddB [Pseudoruegeria sp. SK021]